MIELVDYETYCTLTPEQKWEQRLQGLGEVLDVTGWRPLSDDEIEALDDPASSARLHGALSEADQSSYDPSVAKTKK